MSPTALKMLAAPVASANSTLDELAVCTALPLLLAPRRKLLVVPEPRVMFAEEPA